MDHETLSLLIRSAVCALAAVGFGVLSLSWVRQLQRERGKEYILSRKAERILCISMAVPGGALGAMTEGAVVPLCGLLLLFLCQTVAVTDWTCRIIPNQTVLAIIVLKLLGGIPTLLGIPGFLPFSLGQSLLGLAVCFAVFSLPGLFGKRVGAGDVKLAAAMGFFLGLTGSLLGIMVMGLTVVGYSLLQRRVPVPAMMRTEIPMGPFITGGLFLSFLGSFLIAL